MMVEIASAILLASGFVFTFALMPLLLSRYGFISKKQAAAKELSLRQSAYITSSGLIAVASAVYILGSPIGALGTLMTALAWFLIAISPNDYRPFQKKFKTLVNRAFGS